MSYEKTGFFEGDGSGTRGKRAISQRSAFEGVFF